MIFRRVGLIAKYFLFALLVVCVLLAGWLTYQQHEATQREVDVPASKTPPGSRFVDLQGEYILVQEMGPAEGLPVLFVHGTGAWSEVWKPTMQKCAEAGFRAIAIDLPPFGLSEKSATAQYDKYSQGRRIAGIIDALQLNRVILVGHSFGGGPTMEAAMQKSSKIARVVLVDAALSVSPDNSAKAVHEITLPGRLLQWSWLRDSIVATFLTNPANTRSLLTKFIHDPAKATDEWISRYQYPLSVKGSTQAISAWLPELLSPRVVAASEKPAAYQSSPFSISLIWGELDTITPLAQAQAIQQLSGNIHLDIINGVGHIPQIEDSDKFNKRLLNALNISGADSK